MKISLPSRIPVNHALSFVAVMAAAEMIEGTSFLMCILTSAFLMVGVLAFNEAGGLLYPSGAFVFSNVALNAGLGAVVKVVLGESLDSHLMDGAYTMGVYLAGICSMYIAVLLTVRVRREHAFLESILPSGRGAQIGIGCIVLGMAPPLLLPQQYQNTFAQFNNLILLGILIPVYARAKATGGRKTFNAVAFAAWAYLTFMGLGAASKQGIFTPSAAWLAAAIAAGVDASVKKVVAICALLGISLFVLVPYSQIARNYRDQPFGDVQISLLMHPLDTRVRYQEEIAYAIKKAKRGDYRWFDQPEGIFDRLALVPVDDALIYATDHGHAGNLDFAKAYVVNMIPSFLYPNKPPLRPGNSFAHEIGMLGDDDLVTGISFSAYADGYHEARWVGVTVVLAAFMFFCFVVCDSVGGNIARAPWSLLYLIVFAHTGAEGMLLITTYAVSATTVAVVFGAFVCSIIAPVIGGFFVPPDSSSLRSA